jgi:hypothetical protein
MKRFQEYLLESPASEAASRLGLDYYGFGRYGRGRKVTHHNEFGRLVQVKQQYDPHQGEGALSHLEHGEDEVFNNGAQGVKNAMDMLHGVRALMHGKDDRVRLTQKIDGAPSVVFGKHPQNGKFYVATKAAFNKDPKLNTSHQEIEQNHGHAPGLVQKLKHTLDHLHKIQPKSTHQGDLLYTKDDLSIRTINGEDHVTFKPNTIRYAIPVKSEMGQRVLKSKIGIAVHTKYNESGGRFPAERDDVTDHKDVFVMPHEAPIEPISEKLDKHIEELGKYFKETPKETFDFVSHPENRVLIKQYINKTVREGTKPNSKGLINYIDAYHDKELAGLKTEKAIAKRNALKTEHKIKFTANAPHVERALGVFHRIAAAKHEIVNHLNSKQQIGHYLEDGKKLTPTAPEGYVVIGNKGSLKLVNRGEFSRANFTATKDWKKNA